jgi:hypothetical protein
VKCKLCMCTEIKVIAGDENVQTFLTELVNDVHLLLVNDIEREKCVVNILFVFQQKVLNVL